MTMKVKQYNDEVKQKHKAIDELKNFIAEMEERTPVLEQQYKDSVSKGGNDVDDLFHEIESLKKKIRADKHKLKTLQEVTDEHLDGVAMEVLKGYDKHVRVKHENKVSKALEVIEQAKSEYIKSLDVIDGLNDSFIDDTAKYWQIIRQRDLDKRKVNTISNQFYTAIERPRDIAPSKWALEVTGYDIERGAK